MCAERETANENNMSSKFENTRHRQRARSLFTPENMTHETSYLDNKSVRRKSKQSVPKISDDCCVGLTYFIEKWRTVVKIATLNLFTCKCIMQMVTDKAGQARATLLLQTAANQRKVTHSLIRSLSFQTVLDKWVVDSFSFNVKQSIPKGWGLIAEDSTSNLVLSIKESHIFHS